MRTIYANLRLYAFISVGIVSAVTLGLAAHLANQFLPSLRVDYSIFTIIIPSLTILMMIFLLLRSQPRVDAFALFVLGVLWLTMAAWTVDMVGGVQCSMLGSQTIAAKNGDSFSAVEWCREMKGIEATSWAVFVVFAIFFVLTISLTTRAQAIGRYNAWAQSMSNLQWWSEGANDYTYGPDSSSYGGGYSSANRGYPLTQQYPPNAQIIQQQPGHSLLIRPGQNGQPAVVQQVPGTVIGSQAHSYIPPQDV